MTALQEALRLLTPFDWVAVVFFIVCFRGYGYVVDGSRRVGRRGLAQKTHEFRKLWAAELVKRSNRVGDTALIGNLVNSVTFYANTTIYIIAGLFALLGTLDQLVNITSDLPFSREVSRGLMEIKVLLVLVVFVVAYFKFTWALRQFNLLTILVGGAPDGNPDEAYNQAYVKRLARINSLAGDEFNRGLRGYYFGIASVTWMIHPGLLMAFSAAIVFVLIRRDFYSEALEIMSS
ncbi:MAG TPA: DUF599 domain-containing protein [Limnobacter sp.]|nr:DUF599 domain-containing protein [Limnobacter sp.]